MGLKFNPLQMNGFSATGDGGGGSGADTDLSNLTTTAINQDLIHGTAATNWTVRTANNGAGASGNLVLRSGTATTTRGNVQLAADSVVLGDVGVVTVTAANGGNFGSTTAPWATNVTTQHGIYLSAQRYSLEAGPISTPSSGSVNGTINGKDATGFTIFSASQAGNTGPLSLESGNSSSFASGNIKIQSGTANTTSGNITLQTGTAGTTRGTIALNARYADFTSAPIGSNLVPEANATRNLGTADGVAGWQSLNLARSAAGVVTQYWQGNLKGTMETGPTLPSGSTVALGLSCSNNGSLGLYTPDNGGQTQNVLIETGNGTGGNSGGIYLTTGTSTATRGPIEFSAAVIRNNQVTSTSVVWESGNTASRPGSPVLGQRYFDTDLASGNGMPIWYNGTNWVDATGTTV